MVTYLRPTVLMYLEHNGLKDIKKLYQRSMMGATYRSMSIYCINGTLIKELSEEDPVPSTLEGYCGKVFIILKIQ